MTREQIAGFLMGISVGAVLGYFLKPPDGDPSAIGSEPRTPPLPLPRMPGKANK